jgi:hypothetical protein
VGGAAQAHGARGDARARKRRSPRARARAPHLEPRRQRPQARRRRARRERRGGRRVGRERRDEQPDGAGRARRVQHVVRARPRLRRYRRVCVVKVLLQVARRRGVEARALELLAEPLVRGDQRGVRVARAAARVRRRRPRARRLPRRRWRRGRRGGADGGAVGPPAGLCRWRAPLQPRPEHPAPQFAREGSTTRARRTDKERASNASHQAAAVAPAAASATVKAVPLLWAIAAADGGAPPMAAEPQCARRRCALARPARPPTTRGFQSLLSIVC